VSSTLAIQELRRNPKKAEERITAAVSKAKASGKSKATRKHVEGNVRMQKVRLNVSMATGTPMGDVLKAMATQIRNTVPHSSKDDGDLLSVDGTLTVVLEIPAPEPAPAPAKAPKAPKAAKPAKAAAKPTKAAKPAKAAAKPKSAKKANGGAPAAPAAPAADEGETAKMPPAVPTVDSDSDPDNI
jgi:hypothetical protein